MNDKLFIENKSCTSLSLSVITLPYLSISVGALRQNYIILELGTFNQN